jgi:hypothetical protein
VVQLYSRWDESNESKKGGTKLDFNFESSGILHPNLTSNPTLIGNNSKIVAIKKLSMSSFTFLHSHYCNLFEPKLAIVAPKMMMPGLADHIGAILTKSGNLTNKKTINHAKNSSY